MIMWSVQVLFIASLLSFVFVDYGYTISIPSSLGDMLSKVGLQPLVLNQRYLLTGERLTVPCDVSKNDQDEGITSHQLSFRRQTIGNASNPNMARSRCFNDTDIDYPNSTRAILNMTVTPAMAGTGVFYCYNTPGCVGREMGFSDDVDVEYAPQEVKDFSCVIMNYESMQCTWKDGVTYVDASNVKVDLKFRDPSQRFQPCPILTNHSCTWDPLFNFDNKYIIVLTVSNVRKNVSVESKFDINLNHILMLTPVDDLVATVSLNRPGCVHLQWNHKKRFYKNIFRVKVKRSDHHDDDYKVLTNNLTSTSYDACAFPAYTHLSFSVDVYPQYPFSGHWSTPKYVNEWTPQEAPGSGPSIASGSFVANKSSEAGDFQIRFFWNQVSEFERNGIIDSYQLKTSEGKSQTVSDASTSVIMTFDKTNPFTISVDAHNEAGFSNKPSVWHINPLHITVPEHIQSSFVAKIKDEDLTLYWDDGGRNDDISFTVYWCYGSSPIGNCEQPLNWRHVSDRSTSKYTIPRLAYDHQYKDYSYGISAATSNSNYSTGIFWTQCLSRFATPKAVSFTSVPLVSAVIVSWENPSCTYHSGFLLKHFVIKWCIKSECQDSSRIKSQLIPSSNKTYTINNLVAGTEYLVNMETFSDDGQMKQAGWFDVVPLKEKSKTDMSLVVKAVVGVAVALVITFVTAILIKCFYGRYQLMKKGMGLNSYKETSEKAPQSISRESTHTSSGDLVGSANSSACTLTTLIGDSDRGVNIPEYGLTPPAVPNTPCPDLSIPISESSPSRVPRYNNAFENENSRNSREANIHSNSGYEDVPGTLAHFGAFSNQESSLEGFSNRALQTSDEGEQQLKDDNSFSNLPTHGGSLDDYQKMALTHSSDDNFSNSKSSFESRESGSDESLFKTTAPCKRSRDFQNIELRVVPSSVTQNNTPKTMGNDKMCRSMTGGGLVSRDIKNQVQLNVTNANTDENSKTSKPAVLDIKNTIPSNPSNLLTSHSGNVTQYVLITEAVSHSNRNTTFNPTLEHVDAQSSFSADATNNATLLGHEVIRSESNGDSNVSNQSSSSSSGSSDQNYGKIGFAGGEILPENRNNTIPVQSPTQMSHSSHIPTAAHNHEPNINHDWIDDSSFQIEPSDPNVQEGPADSDGYVYR